MTPKYYFIAVLLLTAFTSCSKFVEIDPPKNKLSTALAFADNETANTAMTAIYTKMNTSGDVNPYITALYLGLCSDELTTYSTALNIKQVYSNSLAPSDALTNDIWTLGYNCIYQANAVIEGCEKSTSLSQDVKIQLTGEALFIRAYWHFYLTNLFGDVPLVLQTDYLINSRLARTPGAAVYDQVIADLKIAQQNLNPNFVGANGLTTTTERVRPNKYAAVALLARVYLFTNKYSEAEQAANLVINNKPTFDIAPLDGVFKKNSVESIWQLMMPTPTQNRNTYEGAYFILTAKPQLNNINSSTLSPQLLAAFEATDQRKTSWIGKFTDATVTPKIDYYYPYKYQVASSATITEYSTVLRLSEQYLIRAEARALQDNLSGAIDDIDVIRKRAGLLLIKNTNPTISKPDLLSAILKERQTELFCEYGHRWLDLKRTGKVDEVMKIVTPIKLGAWDTNFQLFPIPQKDRDNDNQLTQNLGYK